MKERIAVSVERNREFCYREKKYLDDLDKGIKTDNDGACVWGHDTIGNHCYSCVWGTKELQRKIIVAGQDIETFESMLGDLMNKGK